MSNKIYFHTFGSGLRVGGELKENLRSVSICFLIGTGAKDEPSEHLGVSHIVENTLFKGTSTKDARQIADAFDFYGVNRYSISGIESTAYIGAMLDKHLSSVLPLFAEVLLTPSFPEKEIETSKQISLQEIASREDIPMQKLFDLLTHDYYGEPLGRSSLGTLDTVKNLRKDDVQKYYNTRYTPADTIISIVGNFQWEKFLTQVDNLFSNWSGDKLSYPVSFSHPTKPKTSFHYKKLEQVQIGIGYRGVPEGDPNFYVNRICSKILSDGESSRLFTEVREKRGLSYAIEAFFYVYRKSASTMIYAGTTPDRAQETLNVIKKELNRLLEGAEDDELKRAKAGVKNSLIRTDESSTARAHHIADDIFYENRVISIPEKISAYEKISLSDVNKHLKQYPAEPLIITILGPNKIE